MATLFVNLKRFDVPREVGGVSSFGDPADWAVSIIRDTAATGMYDDLDLQVVFILPEAAILTARGELRRLTERQRARIALGTQTVYREDVAPGGNFGAFSANLPAAAARALGCDWAMIGHSEERRDKEKLVSFCGGDTSGIRDAVDRVIGDEVACARQRDLNVLLCIGETAEEHGPVGTSGETDRTIETLNRQISAVLEAAAGIVDESNLVVGYEPVWAIGPGKTPPSGVYIQDVALRIRELFEREAGFRPGVVYGGGLKSANADEIGGLPDIAGGLVALTRFTGEIGFYPVEFAEIAAVFHRAFARAHGNG